jgi:thiol-disulfide isomerase/thioredoxin
MKNIPTRHISPVSVFCLLMFVGCTLAQNDSSERTDPIFSLPSDEITVQFVKEPVQISDLTMHDLNGQVISTTDWHGKVILVNYWATWCGPCREEIPYLIQLQEHYSDQLQVIGISADEGDTDQVKAFAKSMGINYPIVMQTPEINRQFPGVFALPTTFLIDRETRIIQTHVGLINPAVFEQEARYLLDLSATIKVELIDANSTNLLINAAQATELPGLDLSELTPIQKEQALQRLNEDTCECGCALTLAQCRINDSTCGVSLPLAKKVVDEIIGAS